MYYLCRAFDEWSDARVAEEARLESVYTSKAYPEFESRSLRIEAGTQRNGFLLFCWLPPVEIKQQAQHGNNENNSLLGIRAL